MAYEPLFRLGQIWVNGLLLQTEYDQPCTIVDSLEQAETLLRCWREAEDEQ